MDPLTIAESAVDAIVANALATISNCAAAIPITLSRDWANQKVPNEPGVYAVFEGGNLVYVGESGSLRDRMIDLLDSRHHQLRRNIGRKLFRHHAGFEDANSRTKFPPPIELQVEDYIQRTLKIAHYPIYLGRKEIEEKLFETKSPKYNIKGRRS